MAVDQGIIGSAKGILLSGEVPEITAEQRRVGPGGSVVNPTSVIATDRRLIIVNRATLGIRKDYEAIPYRQITSVRFEHGIISSSVFVRVQGYDKDQGLLKNGREEGEIDGLSGKAASELADVINRHIANVGTEEERGAPEAAAGGGGSSKYCEKCGAKNDANARFCEKCGASMG